MNLGELKKRLNVLSNEIEVLIQVKEKGTGRKTHFDIDQIALAENPDANVMALLLITYIEEDKNEQDSRKIN